jgi:hypothetical protein
MVDVSDPPAEIAPAPSPPVAPAAGVVPIAPLVLPAPSAPASLSGAPSLVTAAPLGAGRWGLSLGGGYTVILPLFTFELGYGIARRFDLAFRFETVAGLFHYPQVALRWAFLDAGAWTLGARLGANYSLFAVKSDKTNLTSTVYLSGELVASRPVTRSSDLMFAVRGDFDLWQYRVVDDEKRVSATYRFDGTVIRTGMRTQLTDDLSGFIIGNLRIPVETFQYHAQQFYFVPSIEVGGTFTF